MRVSLFGLSPHGINLMKLSSYNWFCYICLSYHLMSHYIVWLCSWHVFNACFDSNLSIHVCLTLHATWHSQHHSLGSYDSARSSCSGFGAWNLWILPVADQSGAAVAWIFSRPFRAPSFQAPCMPLEFPLSKLVSALSLFILILFLVYLYVSSLLYHSYVVYLLYSRICAY